MEKDCKVCGTKMFVIPSLLNRKKYCSKKCQHKSKEGIRIRVEKVCVFCGSNYLTRTSQGNTQKFCSQKCFGEAKSMTRVKVVCKYCTKEFLSKPNKPNTFCSNKCSFKGRKNVPLKPQVDFTCKHCGKSYKTNKANAENRQYCSTKCHYAFRRKSNFTVDGKKICSVCKEPLLLSEYADDWMKKAGFKQPCKKCSLIKSLKETYNLSYEKYEQMRNAQNNKCAICLEKVEKLVVDHCHTTGMVRGLLCNQCNSGLGFFKENTSALFAAITYLQNTNAT